MCIMNFAYAGLKRDTGKSWIQVQYLTRIFILLNLNDSTVGRETSCLDKIIDGVLSPFVDALRLRSGPLLAYGSHLDPQLFLLSFSWWKGVLDNDLPMHGRQTVKALRSVPSERGKKFSSSAEICWLAARVNRDQ